MSPIENARAIVRAHRFADLADFGEPEGYADEDARGWFWDGDRSRMFYEMDAETLARSLHTFVALDGAKIDDESKVPLGASKLRGLPHLPRAMSWPAGHYFLAQLAPSDVKRFDVDDLLPDRGMLYFFFSPTDACTVAHWDGDSSELELREYPSESPRDAKHYLERFLSSASLVAPSGKYVFYAGGEGDDYDASAALVTDDLRAKLDAALPGFSLAERDAATKLFGRPHYWQGEDEVDDDEEPSPQDHAALLFEDEFGEGHVHVWIERKCAAKRD